MSGTDTKKKKVGGGLRIFQRSVKEMGHGDVLLSHHAHGKSNRHTPTNDKEKEPLPEKQKEPPPEKQKEPLPEKEKEPPPEKQKEPPPENKHEHGQRQKQTTSDIKRTTPEKSNQVTQCKTDITDWQHHAYPGCPKEKTPPRFWKFKVHHETKKEKTVIHEEKNENVKSKMITHDSNNNMQVHSGNVLTQTHLSGTQCAQTRSSDTQTHSLSTVPTPTHSSGIQHTKTPSFVTQTHSFGTQRTQTHSFGTPSTQTHATGTQPTRTHSFGTPSTPSPSSGTQSTHQQKPLPGYLTHSYHHSRTFHHSHNEMGSHFNMSQNSQIHNAPFRRGFQHRSNENNRQFENQDSRYQSRNICHTIDENNKFNKSNNFPNIQHPQKNNYLCEDCVRAGVPERDMEYISGTHSAERNNEHRSGSINSTNSEDWSAELLNVSDWNSDNVLDEHFKNLAVAETTDCRISGKIGSGISEGKDNIAPDINDKSQSDTEGGESIWSEIDLNSEKEAGNKSPDETDISNKQVQETDNLTKQIVETDISKPDDETNISSQPADETDILSEPAQEKSDILSKQVDGTVILSKQSDETNISSNSKDETEFSKKLQDDIDISSENNGVQLLVDSRNEQEIINLSGDEDKDLKPNVLEGKGKTNNLSCEIKNETKHSLYLNEFELLNDEIVKTEQENQSEESDKCEKFLNSGQDISDEKRNVASELDSMCEVQNLSLESDKKASRTKPGLTYDSNKKEDNVEFNITERENDNSCLVFEERNSDCSMLVKMNENTMTENKSNEMDTDIYTRIDETHCDRIENEKEQVKAEVDTDENEVSEARLGSFEITSEFVDSEQKQLYSELEKVDNGQNMATEDHEIWETENVLTGIEIDATERNLSVNSSDKSRTKLKRDRYEMEETQHKMTSNEDEIVKSEQKDTSKMHVIEENEKKLKISEHGMDQSEHENMTSCGFEIEKIDPKVTSSEHKIKEIEKLKITSSEHEIEGNEQTVTKIEIEESEEKVISTCSSEHEIEESEQKVTNNEHEIEKCELQQTEAKHEVTSNKNDQDMISKVKKFQSLESCREVEKTDVDSDASTHGDIYDNLIKEKMHFIKSEKTSKTDKNKGDSHIEKKKRSKSLPESLYMHIVELMQQQFKHRETERNLLLEKQKWYQNREEISDFDRTVGKGTPKPVVGRGRAISLSPYDQSPSSSNSDSTLLQDDEDWENDLIPLDQYLSSDNVEIDLTDDEISGEIANEIDEKCLTKRKVVTPVPVSHSYMTVENCKAQQTPTPFNKTSPKPFVPKGRGCLSPDFNLNLSKFLYVGKKEIPVTERKGFNINERKTPELEKNTDKDTKPKQLEQNARRNSPEDWENSLIDIDNLELVAPGESTNERKLMEDANLTPKNMPHGRQTVESSCQVIENKSKIIENQNFEPIEGYSRTDSSSMSSLPQCELLTFSPKSQSTLSGVPTMSDYENSDVDVGPSDVTKNDIPDDLFDNFCSEGFKVKTTECKNFDNSSKELKNEIKDYIYDNQKVEEKLFMHKEPKPRACRVDPAQDEIDDQFMSYYYPDITSCRCHPSMQQYWVWHTCMCQVPRLCEIRTCLDYWLQYPFRDMEGIYHTVSIPDVNNNRKRETSSKTKGDKSDDTAENIRDCRRGGAPPGIKRPSGHHIMPPPMPFHSGRIPPPNPRQIWDKMMQSRPAGPDCRMAYRGPKPKSSDIPVHLVQHGPHSSRTVVSPFACAQGFYQSVTSDHGKRHVKSRHKSETDNREHDDSGVVVEGSPGFIGPIIPRSTGSPLSAINEGLNEGRSTPRKRLVDYSYSSTEDSEEDRSRSSQVEKRHREEEGVVIVTDDSSSESEASKRLRANVLHSHTSRHFHERKSHYIDETKDIRKVEISSEKGSLKEEGEISDDSDDGSSKFHDCSSTLSNYQILQTVLNQKFPRKHGRKDSSKVDGDSDMVDLTDDGSEIISVVSQESSDKKVKPEVPESKEYSRFWASPDSRNESPICGYPVMFPPYMYPGWVSPEMISAGYGSPSSETVHGYQRRSSCSTPTNPLRKVITSPLDVSTSDMNNEPFLEEGELPEERFKRGSVSIRGMEARLRFLRNSKLAENDSTFQSRLAMLKKNKQTETDSESQSSVTISWKVRFLNKCRGYKGTYIDSHCHLDFLFNRSGFGGTWTKFKEENKDTMPDNFEGCVAVFCHPSSFRQDGLWRDIAEEKDVWLTFGCHPKNATEYTERTELNMKMCLMSPRVVALGEIGLDYSGIFLKHKEVQQTVFRKQIQIALDMNKPLVIHCRDAEEDTLAILDEMVPKNYKIHCHCFTGNYESAKKWMDMFPNLFIGLTPLVTYRTALSTHEVARFIPVERLLLETDAPYFVPRKCPRPEVQHSHPGMAITVAEEVAWLKKVPISEVLLSCRQNTRLMYGI